MKDDERGRECVYCGIRPWVMSARTPCSPQTPMTTVCRQCGHIAAAHRHDKTKQPERVWFAATVQTSLRPCCRDCDLTLVQVLDGKDAQELLQFTKEQQ